MRALYFPVLYQEPFDPAQAALAGFDLLSQPDVRLAVEHAIDTGTAVPSAAALLPDSGHGYWLFRAVYTGKERPEQVEARRASVNGVVALRINMTRLLEQLPLPPGYAVALTVRAGGARGPQLAMVERAPGIPSARVPYHDWTVLTLNKTSTIGIADLHAELRMTRHLSWHHLEYWFVIAACVAGLLITALLAVVTRGVLARHQVLHTTNARLQQEITERQGAEDALRKAHADTEQLLVSIASILIGVDEHDRITRWNTAAEHTFGLAPAQVVGQPWRACGIPWDTTGLLVHLADCRRTHQSTRLDDVRFTRPDGKEGLLSLVLSPIRGEMAKTTGVLLLGLDITEHKLLESQLAQAQKLEAIGQLAAGIAHEINTPTQYVGDNLRFLQDAFADLAKLLEHYTALLQATTDGTATDALVREVEGTAEEIDMPYLCEEIPNAIEQALHGVSRVAEIVRAMKEFAHPGTEDKSLVDLNKAIANTITVARNEWKYVAEVATDFAPALPLVPCFPGDFNQVILNMIVNAAHAIADVVGGDSQGKGTITISTRQEGDWAEIRIADTGTGIPEAVRTKIFDPFFTTKAVGKGTGQGLAISHAVVVKKHGGTLTVETAVGQGTTFIIRLPFGARLEQLGDTP